MVFDDIADLTDQAIQMILDDTKFDREDWALALKGDSEKLQNRIFGMVSDDEAREMKERTEFIGPVRLSDVEYVQFGIVYRVLQLEHDGKLEIPREKDPFV
ncbi:MAG: FliG C-terminal domain-containing protein [Candidatus Latescibacteria bacterium]|jgi:flagellar motor switch protein FliG|nr:FliG C-terminal domain-containing protein [Candidatus Latescibacterota bacterium]